jgi:uncharacterized metal-binding protein (TIGR02443 family)
MKTDIEERPIEHAFLEDSSGSRLRFLELLGEACPRCYPKGELALMYRAAAADKPETVHCVKCDYELTRKPNRQNARLPPMNSPH